MPPPTPLSSNNILLPLWNKVSLGRYARYTAIYRHLLSKYFKNAVQGVKKWCCANVFSDTKQKDVCWKIYKVRKVFGYVAGAYQFQCQVSWGSQNEVFWAKLYCKMSDFFASFCWLWDILLENLKIKKSNSGDVHWNVGTNTKTLYARNNVFKKRIPNMIFWISTLVQISFLGTALRAF